MRRALTALSLAAACVAAPTGASAQAEVDDPLEDVNRGLYGIHEVIDQAVLSPVAHGYRAITPKPVREGVLNFLRNLRGPLIFTNDVLQGEFGRAGITAARFGLNSTLGFAGLMDPASDLGLERHSEDFGQTLGAWGVEPGPYIFVPVIGPTNLRDGAGRIVDVALDPLSWTQFDNVADVRLGRTMVTGLAAGENALDEVENVRRNALDPYVTVRTSYSLLRESAIHNGPTDVQDLPEFEDISEAPLAPETNAEAATSQMANGQTPQPESGEPQ
jgi:phospholipid-binding lipoprotein MlaA